MKEHCPIVCIGASAGGLEALEIFFKYMPDNSGMAFVVVMHLDPSHVSLLPELLQRQTKMDVVRIHSSELVEANKIYVIPANKNLQISNGVLELIERQTYVSNYPLILFSKRWHKIRDTMLPASFYRAQGLMEP